MHKVICAALFAICLSAGAETLVYKAVFSLRIPRVYNNTTSQGYRKYQVQSIRGNIYINTDDLMSGEPAIEMYLTNYTHKVGGSNVTYTCIVEQENVMWRWIGDNYTGDFHKPCLKFTAECIPSYNIGGDEPDNTLIFTWSGYGSNINRMTGYVAGQMGCGCTAYGHVSPTRMLDGRVSDIVPMTGRGTIKLKRRIEQ